MTWKEWMSAPSARAALGLAVLKRLKPFDVKLHYTDKHRLPEDVEKELGLTFIPNVESLVKVCDVVTINCPLHPETEHLFNDSCSRKMKRGTTSSTRPAARSATATRSCEHWRVDSLQDTRVTSGSRSQRRRTIRGGPCRITA